MLLEEKEEEALFWGGRQLERGPDIKRPERVRIESLAAGAGDCHIVDPSVAQKPLKLARAEMLGACASMAAQQQDGGAVADGLALTPYATLPSRCSAGECCGGVLWVQPAC